MKQVKRWDRYEDIFDLHIYRQQLRLRAAVKGVAKARVERARVRLEPVLKRLCKFYQQQVYPFWSDLLFANQAGDRDVQRSGVGYLHSGVPVGSEVVELEKGVK